MGNLNLQATNPAAASPPPENAPEQSSPPPYQPSPNVNPAPPPQENDAVLAAPLQETPAVAAGAPQPSPYVTTPQPAYKANPQTEQAPGAPALHYPTATPLASVGQRPVPVDCPFCNNRDLSVVTEVHGTMTHVTALLCCLVCLCLAFVPYATGMGNDFEHHCARCRKLLAVSHSNGRVEVVAYAPPVPVPNAAGQPVDVAPTKA